MSGFLPKHMQVIYLSAYLTVSVHVTKVTLLLRLSLLWFVTVTGIAVQGSLLAKIFAKWHSSFAVSSLILNLIINFQQMSAV